MRTPSCRAATVAYGAQGGRCAEGADCPNHVPGRGRWHVAPLVSMRSPEMSARYPRENLDESQKHAGHGERCPPVRRGAERCTSERRHLPSACPGAHPAGVGQVVRV